MSNLVYPSAVVPQQFFCVPQQTVYSYEIPNPVQPANYLVSPVDQTLVYWVRIPQEHRLSQESYATAVRMMSVEQTANWIQDLSVRLGWPEAASYAREFQHHAISGEYLPELTDDMLKQFVINSFHRATILQTIWQIFSATSMILPDASFSPQYQKVNDNVSSSTWVEVNTGGKNSEVMHSNPLSPFAQMEESIYTSNTQSVASSHVSRGSFSNTELSQSEVSEVEDKLIATSLRSRSLILQSKSNPSNDHISREVRMKNFRSVFQKHGVKVVEITPFGKSEDCEEFIVKFESIVKAQKALNISEDKNIGYDLRPNWPKRPTATFPCEFRVLSRELTVRAKRQLNSEIVRKMYENDLVYVNKILGRRARLVNKEDGQQLGWTSLFTKQGRPLLEQVEDN